MCMCCWACVWGMLSLGHCRTWPWRVGVTPAGCLVVLGCLGPCSQLLPGWLASGVVGLWFSQVLPFWPWGLLPLLGSVHSIRMSGLKSSGLLRGYGQPRSVGAVLDDVLVFSYIFSPFFFPLPPFLFSRAVSSGNVVLHVNMWMIIKMKKWARKTPRRGAYGEFIELILEK